MDLCIGNKKAWFNNTFCAVELRRMRSNLPNGRAMEGCHCTFNMIFTVSNFGIVDVGAL